MTLTIKSADATDAQRVAALWRTSGLVVPHNDPIADFHFARGKEASDVLLGLDSSGQLVGTVMVGHDGHRGWLYYVAVDPERRTMGLGKQMVRAGEAWLRQRNVPKVQLMVRETNTQVISFYERIGFEAIPRTVMQRWLIND